MIAAPTRVIIPVDIPVAVTGLLLGFFLINEGRAGLTAQVLLPAVGNAG